MRFNILVPLSDMACVITILAEKLGESNMFGRNALPLVLKREKGPARQHHGPTGHTDCNMCPAHDVGIGETGPLGHQPVEVGGLDLCAPKGGNRVKALVIREDKEDVGLALHGRGVEN